MKKLLLGAAVAGTLLGAGTIVGASIPASNGDITACVNRGGAVRIIDASVTACKTEPLSQAEQTLTWPSAQPDVPTISFVRGTFSEAVEITTPGGLGEFRSDCPAGSVAIGRNRFDTASRTSEVVADSQFLTPGGGIVAGFWMMWVRLDADVPAASFQSGLLRALCAVTTP